MRYIAYVPLVLACCNDAIESSKANARYKCLTLPHSPLLLLTLFPRPCSPAQPIESQTNAAFVKQMCGAAACDAYVHLLDMTRAAASCSLAMLVASASDGFVVASRDGSAQE